MDTRSLIALGMILAVLSVALLTKALDGPAAKDVLMMLGSGIVGSLVPRAAARFRHGDTPGLGDLPGPHDSGKIKTGKDTA